MQLLAHEIHSLEYHRLGYPTYGTPLSLRTIYARSKRKFDKDFWLLIKPFFANTFQEIYKTRTYEDCKINHPNITASEYF